MTTQETSELIGKVKTMAATSTEPFDAARAEAVIRAGVIPEGRVLYRAKNGQELRYEAGEARTYTNARLTDSMPATPGTPGYRNALIIEAMIEGKMAGIAHKKA